MITTRKSDLLERLANKVTELDLALKALADEGPTDSGAAYVASVAHDIARIATRLSERCIK